MWAKTSEHLNQPSQPGMQKEMNTLQMLSYLTWDTVHWKKNVNNCTSGLSISSSWQLLITTSLLTYSHVIKCDRVVDVLNSEIWYLHVNNIFWLKCVTIYFQFFWLIPKFCSIVLGLTVANENRIMINNKPVNYCFVE